MAGHARDDGAGEGAVSGPGQNGRTAGDIRPMGPARLLTAEEVAERWQVPKAHVYRLAREGRLPPVQLGRYRRWRLEALEDFERDGGVAANV